MAHPTSNQKDPRVKRTRKLLQDAFKSLICERAFDAISVGDIASRATVNRATFYAHYQDKFDLVDSIFRDELRARLDASFPAPSPMTVSSLETLCLTVFSYLGDVYGRCSGKCDQFDSMLGRAVRESLHEFVAEWLNASRTIAAAERTAVDAAALVMSSAIFGAAFQWSKGDRRQPPSELAKHVVPILTRGVSGSLLEADRHDRAHAKLAHR